MSSPPVGYEGQAYRIVVDETDEAGVVTVRRVGWTNRADADFSSLNTRPSWDNARVVPVPDPEAEGAAS